MYRRDDMDKVTKEVFLGSLCWGDICLVRGKTLFGFFQNWERKKAGVDEKATHGLIVLDPPQISEADGKGVTDANKITRYFSGHHKIWTFRLVDPITETQKGLGKAYLSGAHQAAYGFEGIGEIARKFFRSLFKKKYEIKDHRGIFCTEHTSRFAMAMGIPWTSKRPEEVTPSFLLDWMLDEAVPFRTWRLVNHYDQGDFYL
jgi:hypothetical protein